MIFYTTLFKQVPQSVSNSSNLNTCHNFCLASPTATNPSHDGDSE